MNNVLKNKKIILLGIIAVIIIVILVLPKNKNSKVDTVTFDANQEAYIPEDNISIKINSVEELYKEGMFFDGDYVKVNVTIKNKKKEKNELALLFFNLLNQDGETININPYASDEDGALESKIDANSEITGNLWFETKLEKGMKLQYKVPIITKVKSDGTMEGYSKKYIINLD